MPYMTGLDLVKKVRLDSRFRDLHIVMITTENSKQEVLEAIKAGVNDYITKPFTQEVLQNHLRNLISK